MATTTVHKHEVQLAYSLKKQSAVGTAVGSTDLDKSVRLKSVPLPDFEIEVVDDRDRYSKGTEWATEQKAERYGLKLDLSTDLDPDFFPVVAAMALGGVSSSSVSTSGYSHALLPVDTEDDKSLPVTTMVLQRHPDSDLKVMRDMAVNSFEMNITVGNNQRLELSSSLIGSGHLTASTMTMPSSTISQDYLRAGDIEFKLGTDGAETDLSQELETLKFNFTNNIPEDKSYRAGSGTYRNEFSVGKREATLSFRLRVSKDNWNYHDWLRNQTSKSMVLTITGPVIEGSTYKSIVLDCPNIIFKSVKDAENGEEIVCDVEATMLNDATFGAPFKITVQNTEAAYLVTAS